ncbi:hypothetical protein LJB98_04920 [Bacteroidales bacterium OttesenSCG-928-M11]|nr:hypothetical protein [Bacteroidales bacterium OttesenSCG-928-M11]
MKKAIFFGLILLISLLSCQENTKTRSGEKESRTEEKREDMNKIENIFYEKFGTKPEYAFQNEDGKLIYCAKIDSTGKLIVLEEKETDWEVIENIFTGSLAQSDAVFDSFEIVDLENTSHLYFEVFSENNETGKIDSEYILFRLKDYKSFSVYYGTEYALGHISECCFCSHRFTDPEISFLENKRKASARGNIIRKEMEKTIVNPLSRVVNIARTQGTIHNDTCEKRDKKITQAEREFFQIDKIKDEDGIAYVPNYKIAIGKKYYEGTKGMIVSFLQLEKDHTAEYLVTYNNLGQYVNHLILGYTNNNPEGTKYTSCSIVEGNTIRKTITETTTDESCTHLFRYDITPAMELKEIYLY